MKILYTAVALSTGEGRNGHVRTPDGTLDLDLASPVEMGGSGEGTNPEQLFAAGYAACFHNALLRMARTRKIEPVGSAVRAKVGIGPRSDGVRGFELAAELEVLLPGIDDDVARELADAAHQVCPYSNATRGNLDVRITLVRD